MVEDVHRVRGGALFELAFVAPRLVQDGPPRDVLDRAEAAISRLGTAFQIVDDLTDFEFDLVRGSHNLLSAEIHHNGSPDQIEALGRCRSEGRVPPGSVEETFLRPAQAVLERGRTEARRSLTDLRDLGFWFPPELSNDLVHAIVGLDGVVRMKALADG